MKSTRPDRPEDDLYDPVALNHAVSKLDVYRHERLAYTELPGLCAKVKSRRTGRLRAICRRMRAWFRSFGF